MKLEVNNINLYYEVYGKALKGKEPVIIFLHDSLGCTELWRDFPQKISDQTGISCLCYDRQGYGRSDPFSTNKRTNKYLENEAVVLKKIIDALNLKKVYLFGHSDGGSIAIIAASLYPQTIRGIITEGAHIFVEEITLSGIREAIHLYQTINLKQRLEKYHGEKTEMVFKLWTETWLSPEFQDWNIESYLNHIICPSLIIQGEEDEYGSLDQVESIVKNTKGNSERLVIKDSGHSPHKETPLLVASKTVGFIRDFNP